MQKSGANCENYILNHVCPQRTKTHIQNLFFFVFKYVFVFIAHLLYRIFRANVVTHVFCLCVGSAKFPVCDRADASRILPSDSRWKRYRTIVEEVHLQGNFAYGRSGARVLQVTQFFGATGIDKRFETNYI